MKLPIKMLSIAVLLSTASLINGYAILHNSYSKIPYVDIYVWRADSAQRAKQLMDDFASKLNVPQQIIDVLDAANGVSGPVAAALGPATSGASVAVKEGFSKGVEVTKAAYGALGSTISDLIGKVYRGKDDAFHANVPRGNKGRFAEWKNPAVMYAIVTVPGTLIPLHAEPQRLDAGAVLAVTVNDMPDPAKPGNMIYRASFDYPLLARPQKIGGFTINPTGEYIPAEQDTRNLNQVRELAKESGAAALKGSK